MKTQSIRKPGLHPRNKHGERYDFKSLTESLPELAAFVRPNDYGDESIDFFDPKAVKILNKALLKTFYGIDNWDIPEGYLCPPVPGRADYIHHIADLLSESNSGKAVPTGKSIRCLDIGTGANCIYPIIGVAEYGWTFVGSDIDPTAIASAQQIVNGNELLRDNVTLRLQADSSAVFRGIIQPGEHFDLTICNPPFHASAADASSGTLRKLKNLKQQKQVKPVLNFGGKNNELWCEGGEERFVGNMITESREFAASCKWFSTLISKESNLRKVYSSLKKAGAADVRTLEMSQGNKTSRIVAWRFQSEKL